PAAGHSHGSGQAAALAQILQIVDDGHQVQVFFGLFQGGDNGLRGLVGVPQTDGQTDQQGLGQTDGFAVHKKDVVYIGQIGTQMSGLAGAGQLAGKEDADDSVACLGSLPEIGLEQLGAGLAGGGQLAALGQAGI